MLVSSEERRAAAAGSGEVSPSSGPRSADGPSPRPSRRSFSAEYKLAIVAEYENAPNGEKGAVLRREGLYSSHVIEWTRARDAGALAGVTDSRRSVKQPKKSDGGGGVGTAPSPQRETRSRSAEDADRVGHHGKSTRALGAAVRERGRPDTTGAADEALRTAFTELRAAQVSIARACALTGRSRATHYRRADPAGVTLGPLHGPHRPRRRPPCTLTDDERGRGAGAC